MGKRVRHPGQRGDCSESVARPGGRLGELAGRLSDESGFALVMAIMMMLVLSLTVTTVIGYSTTSARSANLSASGQDAYALAEAGINNAMSVITVARADTTQLGQQPTVAGDANSTVTTYAEGGTATWGGSYAAATKTWTIKSIGSARNPTGGAAPLTRTLYATVSIPAPPYSFVALDTSCDNHTLILRTGGHLTVTNGVYVNSCNTGDGFDIKGTVGLITAPTIETVGGWEVYVNSTQVRVGGTQCPVPPLKYSYFGPGNASNSPQIAGCPTMGSPILADPFVDVAEPPVGAPACPSPAYGSATSYSPTLHLKSTITSTQTAIVVKESAPTIPNGEIIIIDSEKMYVTSGGGTVNLTVQRAAIGTAAASHNKDKEIKAIPVIGTGGNAALPTSCKISSGAQTLQPGTYYGGICIGVASEAECGLKVGGTCTTTSSTTANVTLAAGTYIMAGGGFSVCGSSTLSAPDVLIYNTQDDTNTAGAGAIEQFKLNTTGSVDLGPQATGRYAGLTIFEDRTLSVAGPASKCDAKSKNVDLADIAFSSTATTGANGKLGSISGTIYAPGPRAIYSDYMGGIANIALMISCIAIDGTDSTYDFQDAGLFGVDITLGKVWG
ncbi:MAG: hypothetical protein EXQ81_04355 [Thermoleophilia bacterium]|nr:hypothetical protein [Thermoleophilia bacterium]